VPDLTTVAIYVLAILVFGLTVMLYLELEED